MTILPGLVLLPWVTATAFSQASAGPSPTSATHLHHFTQSTPTNASPGGWTAWTPRPEISPRLRVDTKGGRSGGGALEISTRNRSEFGAWRATLGGLTGERTYRFSAWYQARSIPFERRSVIARLEWLDAKANAVRPPDYALDTDRHAGWTRVEYTTTVPTNACQVDVQLSLGFADRATVRWDDIELMEEPSPRNRVIRAMTVFHRPRGTKSAAESVEQFCRLVEEAGNQKPDIVCLPEGITVVSTSQTYAQVSEPVPGPTTRRLGDLASKLGSYVVAALYERSGRIVYNTAVLIGRDGRLVGTYRKTHLPREEWEQGITPGEAYPVFDTDFGRVGIMICWDLQFPEPARALAAQGAEVILLPIWGGSEVLARARAIENCVFLVSSSYDMKTYIVDPAGQVLVEATKAQPVVTAELHLDRAIYQPWIGDMKTRTWKERRADLPVP
jgi:predicted amidohydrolase